jgi:hypothetical protein
MAGGAGKVKGAKSKDRLANFASLVKALLESIKNRSPELAEDQIQPEIVKDTSKSGKSQDLKPGVLAGIPQNKDKSGLLKEKNLLSEPPGGKTEGIFSSNVKETDENAGIFASLTTKKEIKDLPFSAEEGEFPREEAIRSLADLVKQRGDADALTDRERAVLFTGIAAGADRAGSAEKREARMGLVDLNRAAKNGEQEGVKNRRRERLARGPGGEGRFEIRDFRGDAAPKDPGVKGDFGLSGRQELPETELVVQLGGRSTAEGGDEAAPRTAPFPLREALAQELRGALGQDIVRHASMVLKDGGEGLIRLSLKPESLGNVKIRLELSENKIAGHIIVENTEALRAFERELPVLEAAFKDSGFSGASLELAQSGAGGEGGRRSREEASPFYSERLAASSYEALTGYGTGNSEAFIRANTRVNMLA